jgi:hypothetical protein
MVSPIFPADGVLISASAAFSLAIALLNPDVAPSTSVAAPLNLADGVQDFAQEIKGCGLLPKAATN